MPPPNSNGPGMYSPSKLSNVFVNLHYRLDVRKEALWNQIVPKAILGLTYKEMIPIIWNAIQKAFHPWVQTKIQKIHSCQRPKNVEFVEMLQPNMFTMELQLALVVGLFSGDQFKMEPQNNIIAGLQIIVKLW